jgi:CheY-like chemotaxis protein
VADTGCGMTDEVRERRIRALFHDQPVGKGTGLGLSQIFGFSHQSGGEVGIESEIGKGTTVSLYLPRTEEGRAGEAASAGDGRRVGAHGSRRRILLVEDDPRVRAATVDALEDLDYQPVACDRRCSRPFTLFRQKRLRPGDQRRHHAEMTGPELIRILKAPQAGDRRAVRHRYVGEGESEDLIGYDLLRKPFTVGALASAVASALARPVNEPRRTGGAAAAG